MTINIKSYVLVFPKSDNEETNERNTYVANNDVNGRTFRDRHDLRFFLEEVKLIGRFEDVPKSYPLTEFINFYNNGEFTNNNIIAIINIIENGN